MSVVCDRRPMPDPLAACGGGVRQGKRKEVEREEEEETSRPGFYIDDVAEEENGSDQSSIGVASNDCSSSSFGGGGGDEEDEVESKPAFKDALLGSFDSLEESLPIKRGLSNFFSGKSKSFTTLPSMANSSSSSVASAADLAKKENPFNKRRRVLMAACNRRASCGSFVAHLPPLLSPQRETEEKDGDATDDDSDEEKPTALMVGLSRKGRNGLMMNRSLAAPRSYSLSDLQQHV